MNFSEENDLVFCEKCQMNVSKRNYILHQAKCDRTENLKNDIACSRCFKNIDFGKFSNHECICVYCNGIFMFYLIEEHENNCEINPDNQLNHNYDGYEPDLVHNFSNNSNINEGLNQELISIIPVFIYKKEINKIENEKCDICYQEYDNEEKLKFLNCFHKFHSICIDKWLMMKAECPICKEKIKQIE